LPSLNLDRVIPVADRRGGPQHALAIPVLYVGALAAALLLIADGRLVWLGLIVVGVAATAVAYRFALLTVAALLALWALPMMFADTSWQTIVNLSVSHVPIGDLPLLPMAAAVAVRAVVLATRTSRQKLPRIWHLVVALAAVLALIMLTAVASGFLIYRLSAVREFTINYLGLIVVPYVGMFVRSPKDVNRMFKAVAVFSLAAPLLLLPLIGHLKGWAISGPNRFYPASSDMGLLYAVVAAYVLSRSNHRWRKYFAVIVIPVVAFIIADSNRSVWLAGIVAYLVLVAARRIRLARFWKWGLVTVLVAVAATAALTVLGKDPVGFIMVRGRALTDPAADPTASWRLALWRSALGQSQAHLVFGQGFGVAKGVGAYFSFNLATGGNVTVIPHNMYVMTLYNLGLVGLLAYVALAAALVIALLGAGKRSRRLSTGELEPILLMGLVAALASLAYGIPYTFEEYSMLYIGLGLAAALLVLRQSRGDDVRSVSGATASDGSKSGVLPAAPGV
jgi:O-antigen ligase